MNILLLLECNEILPHCPLFIAQSSCPNDSHSTSKHEISRNLHIYHKREDCVLKGDYLFNIVSAK